MGQMGQVIGNAAGKVGEAVGSGWKNKLFGLATNAMQTAGTAMGGDPNIIKAGGTLGAGVKGLFGGSSQPTTHFFSKFGAPEIPLTTGTQMAPNAAINTIAKAPSAMPTYSGPPQVAPATSAPSQPNIAQLAFRKIFFGR